MSAPIRVLLVDDHEIVTRGLAAYLATRPDLEVVGTAATGEDALTLAAATSPDVAVVDVRMPGMGGIAATRTLVEEHDVHVVVLTSSTDRDDVLGAIAAGARGFVRKDADPSALDEAVRVVAAGGQWVDPREVGTLMGAVRDRTTSPVSSLTPREREVLVLLGRGRTNAEIADELVVSIKTVKTHVSHVLAKLAVTDRTQAALVAVREGLLDAEH